MPFFYSSKFGNDLHVLRENCAFIIRLKRHDYLLSLATLQCYEAKTHHEKIEILNYDTSIQCHEAKTYHEKIENFN